MAEGDHLTMLNVYEAFIKVQCVYVCVYIAQAVTVDTTLWACETQQKLTLIEATKTLSSFLQHQKSSQWCQEHFLNYKGLLRAVTVREQLRRLMNKFKVPRTSSEGVYASCLFYVI